MQQATTHTTKSRTTMQLTAAMLALGPLTAGCEKTTSHPAPSANPANAGAAGAASAAGAGSAGGGGSAGGAAASGGAGASSAGGGGSAAGGGSSTRTYTLYWTVQKEPAGGVKVAIDVPADWQETIDGMGGPSFRGNGLGHGPDVVLLPAMGADDKARVETLVHRQYDDAALASAEREDGGDGSVWIASKRADGYVDARRFLAAGGDNGVVVCVLSLTPTEAARLPELKKICATLRLAP